jgi:prepilin peptidase CpaA
MNATLGMCVSTLTTGVGLPPLVMLVLVAVVITAGLYDLRYRRIPNRLNLAAILAGFCLNAYCFHGAGILSCFLGLSLAMLVYLPLYLLRGIGAGDVKLMMAVGAIVGPSYWFGIFLATALIGGLLAAGLILVRRRVLETVLNVQFLLSELAHFRLPHAAAPELDVRNSQGLRLPHGVSIALGSLSVLMLSSIPQIPDCAM